MRFALLSLVGPPRSEFHYSPSRVGPPRSEFHFWWVRHLPSSVTVAFRATKIPTTLEVDVPVAIRATKNMEGNMLPVNYQS